MKLKKHPGHKRFYELLKEMEQIHDRKNHNYAQSGDPLSNLRGAREFGLPPYLGVFIRMQDKWCRLIQLLRGKKDQVGENIKDTLLDLANYCLLAIILLEENGW